MGKRYYTIIISGTHISMHRILKLLLPNIWVNWAKTFANYSKGKYFLIAKTVIVRSSSNFLPWWKGRLFLCWVLNKILKESVRNFSKKRNQKCDSSHTIFAGISSGPEIIMKSRLINLETNSINVGNAIWTWIRRADWLMHDMASSGSDADIISHKSERRSSFRVRHAEKTTLLERGEGAPDSVCAAGGLGGILWAHWERREGSGWVVEIG